jgi:hypothetical protein
MDSIDFTKAINWDAVDADLAEGGDKVIPSILKKEEA